MVLAIAGALLPGDDDKKEGPDSAQVDKSSNDSSASAGSSGADESKPCGSQATDDCTPHVGAANTVRVDAIVWRITSAKTAATLGDQQYGLGEKADGVFVIVGLQATSRKDESATLTDEAVSLSVNGGNTYKADNDGTVAAIGAGQDPFFLEDIGPDSTIRGPVVFDVPRSVLGKKLEMRFGELGFGSTKGYIKLPPLAD